MRSEEIDRFWDLWELRNLVETDYGPHEPLLRAIDACVRMLLSPPPNPKLAFDARPKWHEMVVIQKLMSDVVGGRLDRRAIDDVVNFAREITGTTVTPPSRSSSTKELIREAARRLGKPCRAYPKFEDYRRALCDTAGVNYNARGWQEDSVREALRGTEWDPRKR